MSIIQGNAKQGSTRGFYPKVINGSLRFNDDESTRLEWTPDSAGNRKTWTFSCWVKRSKFDDGRLIHAYDGVSSRRFQIRFRSDNAIGWDQGGSGTSGVIVTPAVFRDPSAWYHVVCVADYSNATVADRAKIYVNGVRQAVTTTDDFDNADGLCNATILHDIGTSSFGAYLANVHFIDGQALTASDFGETKNGVWVAKDYAGTFGTNGFYLTFEDDTEVEAFNTVLYRGNATDGNRVTGVGFKPDLIWTKTRDSANEHFVMDSVRGTGVGFEITSTYGDITGSQFNDSFDPDGFTVNSGARVNRNGENFVAWCWKAGDSNVSNTDGTITSTVRANDTYGFSIVSYTGTGANATVGHGLSSAPDMVIVKTRDSALDWPVFHTSLGGSNYVKLNTTNASTSAGAVWNSTAPTSSVIHIGTNTQTNTSGDGYIAYCWAEKTGYSKFGSYTGNGTSQTITTGFKPAFVLVKRTDSTNNWFLFDNTRATQNDGTTAFLRPNLSDAEASNLNFDLLDTGFAPQDGSAGVNGSGATYIYAAFADTREAAFWLDQSGNDNDWQPVNLDHNDTVADSPTNNFCTMNPLDKGANVTLSNGNLTANYGNAHQAVRGTQAISSGKFYWEVNSIWGSNQPHVGIMGTDAPITEQAGSSRFYGYRANGDKIVAGVATAGAGATWDQEGTDTIGVALDMDAGEVSFYKNNTLQFTITGLSGEFAPVLKAYATDVYQTINFGQQPFKYDPPE
jgi:hypothetical protein